MQDHLRSHPAVLVQDEFVVGLHLAECEFWVVVEEAGFAGFVVGVEGFRLVYGADAEVDLRKECEDQVLLGQRWAGGCGRTSKGSCSTVVSSVGS